MPTPVGAILVLVIMIGIALALRSGLMLFSSVSVIVTQLPVSFIAPRGAFVLYVPMVFWALYAIGFLSAATPLLDRPLRSFAAFLVLAALLVPLHLYMKLEYDQTYVPQTIAYREFSRQLDRWNVHLPENGRVLLPPTRFRSIGLAGTRFSSCPWRPHDPGYCHSPEVRYFMATEAELAWYNYVIDYDAAWRLLKRPGEPEPVWKDLQTASTNLPSCCWTALNRLHAMDGRNVHRSFAIRTLSTAAGAYELSMSLAALEPVRLSRQLDAERLRTSANPPGSIQIVVPIPAGPPVRSTFCTFRRAREARNCSHQCGIASGPVILSDPVDQTPGLSHELIRRTLRRAQFPHMDPSRAGGAVFRAADLAISPIQACRTTKFFAPFLYICPTEPCSA